MVAKLFKGRSEAFAVLHRRTYKKILDLDWTK